MLTRSTRTAGVRCPKFAQIFDDTFRLSHTCCFDSGRCGCVCPHYVLKSFLAFCGVSLPRHWQSGAVNFAGWASCRVTKTFQGLFYGCGHCGPFVVAVIGFGWSRNNVWLLWDDQHWLKQICRNIAWVRLLRRCTDTLQQSVVVSMLFWDSSHRLNNIGHSLVHDNALSCLYWNTHKHTSRPPRLQNVSSALSLVHALTKTRHLNSPALTFQTHVGCVTIVRLNLCGRVGEDWNNPRPTKPTADFETRT